MANLRGTGRGKRDIFLPLAIGDYLRDTPHFRARQHGAYLLLLMAAWVSGGRLGYCDEDLRTIARLSPEEWAEDRPRLAPKFEIAADGAWIHRGMQRRMQRLGLPVDAGPGAEGGAGAGTAREGAASPPEGGRGPADRALSAKRSAAARRRWERDGGAAPEGAIGGGDDGRDGASGPGAGAGADAGLHEADANLHPSDAKTDASLHRPDANRDANLHPVLHSNLNLKESSNHQPSSLPAARAGAPALGDGGGLVDKLLRIFNNPAWVNASVFAEVIREWRGLGLSDDAICIEVASVLDAKRMQKPGWVPGHPGYCTPALRRLAESEAAATRLPPDPWAQRVASYAKTKFWLDEWGGRPDDARPNPAIAPALLVKHGFKKEEAA
jgi:uncharacterized protein YdaU (DUF1376 family)